MHCRAILLWIELLAAGAVLATAATVAPASTGGGCKTTPCTYFTKTNAELSGKCGAVTGEKGCYCIVKVKTPKKKREKRQLQSGCDLVSTE
jgi:hypothetical protein